MYISTSGKAQRLTLGTQVEVKYGLFREKVGKIVERWDGVERWNDIYWIEIDGSRYAFRREELRGESTGESRTK